MNECVGFVLQKRSPDLLFTAFGGLDFRWIVGRGSFEDGMI